MSTRMAWSGACDSCRTLVSIVASDEIAESEQEAVSSEWPDNGDCYAQGCYGQIEWNGNDPAWKVFVLESTQN